MNSSCDNWKLQNEDILMGLDYYFKLSVCTTITHGYSDVKQKLMHPVLPEASH
jgi:hypothetical protein